MHGLSTNDRPTASNLYSGSVCGRTAWQIRRRQRRLDARANDSAVLAEVPTEILSMQGLDDVVSLATIAVRRCAAFFRQEACSIR